MTRKVQRKIHIGESEYVWVANCNDLCLYPFKEMVVRVYLLQNPKSILYIDANAWHFEMSPKHIKDAVKFALLNGWEPATPHTEICLSKNENGYFKVSLL
ncbi:hypothetical protein [Vibrio parahaemolyticus]|uniref:hypothetical protein n=1 Tax=Vibrio parahaemolyticus TaxID=670 RepID=UPI001559DA2E|nr:hypothetical protein [Vibrio parahaemolyticus]